MAARRSKNADTEQLTDANIERVIKYLEEKGATKKTACQMLCMSYNTTRLDKIITDFLQKKERDAQRRKEKRGKPATPEEVQYIISEYLSGTAISDISKSVFRGSGFIYSVLESYSVPERSVSHNYFEPKLLPEEAVRDRFAVGETVYSARYDTLAVIKAEMEKKVNDSFVYSIWLKGDWQQYAYQPAYELASLEKLKEAGVQI